MTHRFKALLGDSHNTNTGESTGNPIHSALGGQQHGFRAALVPGVYILGLTSHAFINLLGDAWLQKGWVDVTFRRPVYDGDAMTVNLVHNRFTVTNPACDVCLEGRVGIGEAPFSIAPVPPRTPEPSLETAPRLTLDAAPVGQPLRSLSVRWDAEMQQTFIDRYLQEIPSVFSGERGACHVAWISRQPIDLLHHSFRYGAAIHTRTQLQFLAPMRVGQKFVVAGRCAEVFEKRGHHYITNECAIFTDEENECARLRHTAIFRLRSENLVTD